MKTHAIVKVRQVARCTVLTIPAAIKRRLDLKSDSLALIHLTEEGTLMVRFYKAGVDRLIEARTPAMLGEMLSESRQAQKKS